MTFFGFEFVERYHKDANKFLSHITLEDELYVSLVNVETEGQQNSGRINQKTYRTCFPGQERSVDGGVQATRNHSNIRNVL
jgi:hypothetical protein